MKKLNLKEMSNEELVSNYIASKNDLFGLKFQLSVNQLTDPNKINTAKKNIARALTEMTVRGIDYNKIKMPVVKKADRVKKAKKVEKPKNEVKPAKAEKVDVKPVAKKPVRPQQELIKLETVKVAAKTNIRKVGDK